MEPVIRVATHSSEGGQVLVLVPVDRYLRYTTEPHRLLTLRDGISIPVINVQEVESRLVDLELWTPAESDEKGKDGEDEHPAR